MKVLNTMRNDVKVQGREPNCMERGAITLVDNSDARLSTFITSIAGGESAGTPSCGQYRRLKPGINLSIKLAILVFGLAIFSSIIILGVGVYRELRFNRHLNDEQNRHLARLEEHVTRTDQQVRELTQTNGNLIAGLSLSTRLWDDYRNGVCLISGTYEFIDPETGRPWRVPSKQTDKSGELSTQEREGGGLTTEGDGDVAQVDYEGTGFHVGSGYILTNRHIAFEPWKYDVWVPIFGGLIKGKPHLSELRAFFPGQQRAYPIKFKLASSEDDIAVCILNITEIPKNIPLLPLDQDSASVAVGQPIVMMGYSGGIDRLLSLLPETEISDLQGRYGESGLPLIRQLARRGLMNPLTSQGHVMDLTANQIIYDAATGGGGSGSPIFGPSGRVIGIHYGYHQANRITNAAVKIDPAKTLLQRAGWRPTE